MQISNLPSGTVTFLFTDIEGSTKLAREHPETWEAARACHHAILQAAMDSYNGYVFQIIGDAFCVAFHTASEGLDAAMEAQQKLQNENWGETPIKVRMGIHTGDAEAHDNEYRGYLTMSLVQRVMSAGHGGQILLSNATENLLREQLPKDVSLRDMGEHKFKDMHLPTRVFQVVAVCLKSEFPALRALDVFPNNLPTQLTSFVGRGKELTEVKQMLKHARLLTLTGSGGTGKTRLSLQAASDVLQSFKDGIWFVELAPISDPALVAITVANVLQVREEPGRLLMTALLDWLGDKELLLILDNCEHLIDACAQLADSVLHDCSRVRILASSREALGIAGETAYRVPSLQTPDPREQLKVEQFEAYASVQLFIERAAQAHSTFKLTNDNAKMIAQICQRLDGIPLAIELAAARIRMLSVEQISARLDDRFRLLTGGSRNALPRQQTLRALIDWSYALLSESERTLLRRLTVFSGGWTLELAEQVCSDEKIDQYEVLDMLGRLVDKSLVSVSEDSSETCYRMLETVRLYAREKLFESGESENARNRHLQAFIELAEKAEPEIRGLNQLIWLDRLDEELDNLRTALEWSQECDSESFLRLASTLWRFWNVRGHIADEEWLRKALAATEDLQTVLRARALGRAAYAAWVHSYPQQGRALAKEAEILSRALDDKAGLAMALMIQGTLELNYTQGLALLDQALALSKELDDQWLMGIILALQADLLMNQNDLTSARSFMEQSLKESQGFGDKRLISSGLRELGEIALALGDAVQAEKWFQAALVQAQEIRDTPNIWINHSSITLAKLLLEDFASAKEMLAKTFRFAQIDKMYRGMTFLYSVWIDTAQGNVSRAIEQAEEGLILVKQTTNRYSIADLNYALGDALRRKGDFAQAITKYKEALAIYQGGNYAAGYCDCLDGCGMLAIDQGQAARGACLLGARERLRACTYNNDYFPFMVREREAHITAAREQLGEDAFNQAWAEGKAMSTEEAIKYALEEMQ